MAYISEPALKRSKFIVLSFSFLLVLAGSVSQFFQSPTTQNQISETLTSPVSNINFTDFSTIKFANRLGEFLIQKENDTWRLIEPRNLLAQQEIINNLMTSLSSLKTKRFYENDTINTSNFSLDRPTVMIKLGNHDGDFSIVYGLFNAIDNSTYVKLSEKNFIYQIEIPSFPLQTLSLSDLINSHILKEPLSQTQKISIYRTIRKKTEKRISLTRLENDWVNDKNKTYIQQRALRFINALFSKKAEVILDKRSEDLNKRVEQLKESHFFKIVLKQKKTENTYYVSFPLNSLPDFNIEKKKYVLVVAEKNFHPVLVDKDLLDILNIRESRLRSPNTKKLFY